jgi:hypothetical protein
MKINDVITDDSTLIATAFNNFYTSIPETIHAQIPPAVADYTQNIPFNPSTAAMHEAEPIEIFNIINSLANKNSSLDNITSKIIKYINYPISEILSVLFNNCFKAGVYPGMFKKAKITPVYKKGSGSTLSINNHRPISILHTINKIFEKLTYNRILNFMNHFNLLSKTQYGFKKNSSTEHAALHLINKISPAFTLKHSNITIFIDFSKAFDTVLHSRLLDKLYRYGFRGIFYNFLKSYLEMRFQSVKIKDSISPELPVSHGVPQGSCLAPLLFNIYTNDIFYLPFTSDVIQYADDTGLTLTHPSIEELTRLVNIDVALLYDFCAANGLALNVGKTKAMLFSPTNHQIQPAINIGAIDVEFVSSYKYLGIEIDCKLKYNVHLNTLKSKLAKAVGMTYSLGKMIDIQTAKSIYFSLAHSHIIYMISLWGSSAQTRLAEIQVQQNKIIRNLFRHRFPDLSTTMLFKKVGLLSVTETYKYELGKLMFQSINTNKYPIINEALNNLSWNHNFNTRKIDTYRLPRARVLPDYNGFLFQGVKLWNEFPIDIRSSNTLLEYKTAALKHFLALNNV